MAVNDLLPRSKFGDCIGMKKSEKFAEHLFDTPARRKGIKSSSLTKEQVHELYELLSDKSFDSRLQIFFDMVDKDGDGKISRVEVKEVIMHFIVFFPHVPSEGVVDPLKETQLGLFIFQMGHLFIPKLHYSCVVNVLLLLYIQIIALSASTNKLVKIEERLDHYTELIMEALDPRGSGYVEIGILEKLLLIDPSPSMRLLGAENRKLNQLLSMTLHPDTEKNPIKRVRNFVEDNWQRIRVVVLWVLICVGIFTWKFIEFKHKTVFKVLGYCVSTAKGGGEILKFNMALTLLTVCRNTITWLRSKTNLGVVVPFDDNINFHMLVAVGIVVGVGLHVGSHTACNFPRILHATDDEYQYIKKIFGEDQPPNYWWFLKGTEGWTGIVMILLMVIGFTLALPCFRTNRFKKLPNALKKITGYNSFWYSHHLFVILYALYIVHGLRLYITRIWYEKTTWMYLAIPIALYACERLTRTFRSYYKTVKITKVRIAIMLFTINGKPYGFICRSFLHVCVQVAIYPFPVEALELHMSKPKGFKYRSGQYLYVKCPSISRLEWHPFSITSAPSEEHLSVHIKKQGDWTEEIKTLFILLISSLYNVRHVNRLQMLKEILPEICIDGPYGAPSQDYKNYDILLLVGLGVGATPMISIMKDVLHNIKQRNESTGRKLESGNQPFVTSQAYFYWSTREEESFEWFKEVLNEVSEKDQDNVIKLHIHCTNVFEEGDARAALITMLQSLHHEKAGVDIIAETRVKIHFARPVWRNVFEKISVDHPEQIVGVFYCGAPQLVTELKKLSRHFSRKTKTKFEFHKENF
ncbi:hypothetical protein ACHQM5_022103 [Ranunculus cassubicifolius]